MSRWTTIAPIPSEWKGPAFDVTAPIDIGWGVHLVPLPDWLKHESITRLMSWIERERFIGEAKFALALQYDADSHGELDPNSTMGPLSKQFIAAEKLRRANLALWMARPSREMGFNLSTPPPG